MIRHGRAGCAVVGSGARRKGDYVAVMTHGDVCRPKGFLSTFKWLSALLGVLLMGSAGCGYNSLVSGQEEVNAAWAQVENVYQRRADLVPNLVATVKGSAQHEQQTLTAVTQARANATGMKLSAADLSDPAKVKAYEQAQAQLSQGLGRLLAVAESYPDLKANANFRDLQVQLEGTENRITVERRRYNEAVQRYNTQVRSFPTLVMAKAFGFQARQPFQATTAGAERAPEVKF